MIIKSIMISISLVLISCSNRTNNSANEYSSLKRRSDALLRLEQMPEKYSQLGNIITNCNSLYACRKIINSFDNTSLHLVNVLHIGDSHLKSGFYSEPLMQKLNNYYGPLKNGNLFFSFQQFCKTGTKYSDYNDLAELDSQLVKSKFNLIIISLGTNDAFSGSSQKNFYEKIDNLVLKIRNLSPMSSILITTPPDALKNVNGTYTILPEFINAVNVILKYCKDKSIACWNLYQIMGGAYTINNWYLQKLASPDRIHYTAKGYDKFSQWLFEAFVNCMSQT